MDQQISVEAQEACKILIHVRLRCPGDISSRFYYPLIDLVIDQGRIRKEFLFAQQFRVGEQVLQKGNFCHNDRI